MRQRNQYFVSFLDRTDVPSGKGLQFLVDPGDGCVTSHVDEFDKAPRQVVSALAVLILFISVEIVTSNNVDRLA